MLERPRSWRSIRFSRWSPSGKFSLDFPYAFDGPHRFNEAGAYADPRAELASSETVTAAIEAGLRIDSLIEQIGHLFERLASGLSAEGSL